MTALTTVPNVQFLGKQQSGLVFSLLANDAGVGKRQEGRASSTYIQPLVTRISGWVRFQC